MNKEELEKRTKAFALRVIQFVNGLPQNKAANVLGYQLLRSGTSVGANYREANRAESHDDFIHKIGMVEKEASETQYWFELLSDANLGNPLERDGLAKESSELVAIFTAVGRTAKARRTARVCSKKRF